MSQTRRSLIAAAFGGMLAMAVMVGNMTIPLAVWTGLVK